MYSNTENSSEKRGPWSAARAALPVLAAVCTSLVLSTGAHAGDPSFDYRVLATSKTSTMERELNEAAAAGYRLRRVMAGKAMNGGQVLVAMVKDAAMPGQEARQYRLLSTTKTSTMQTEMQQLADGGYAYVDHVVFESAAGGKEIAVIMERDPGSGAGGHASYRLLATTRSSTMEKELREAGAQGYALLGLAAGKTASGSEVIAILRRDQ